MAFRTLLGNAESVALSPDARTVAYSVRSSDRDLHATHSGFLANGVPGHAAGAEIWLTSVPEGARRVLTPDWGSSWCPRWSPEGKLLAFYSDREGEPRIWLWDRDNDTFHVACSEPICVAIGFEGVHWCPDSRRLVAKLRTPNWSPPADNVGDAHLLRQVWMSPHDDRGRSTAKEGWRLFDACRGDLSLVDVGSGAAWRLGTEIYPFGTAASPDGRYVAAMCFADMPSELDGNLGLFDLHLFAVDGSFHCILAAKVPARRGTAFSWSPQSDEIAYTSCAGEAGELIVVSRDGTRRMSPSAGGTCLGNRQGYPPLWSPDGSTIYCTTGGSVYAVSRATGEVRDVTGGLGRYVFGIVHSLESGTVSEFGVPGTVAVMARDGDTLQEGIFRIGAGKPEVIVAESNRSLVSFLLYGDAQGDWIVGQAEDPASPPDLLGVNVTSGEQRRLTRLNPHIDIAPQGCRRLISYHGPRGEHLRASLMLPPKPRAREDLSNDHPALLWTGAVTVQELV